VEGRRSDNNGGAPKLCKKCAEIFEKLAFGPSAGINIKRTADGRGGVIFGTLPRYVK
jgi:hypothetical protein